MSWIVVALVVMLLVGGGLFLLVVSRVRTRTLPYTLALEDGTVAERARRRDWFAAVRGELERLGFAKVSEFTLPGLRGNVVNAAMHQAHPPTYAVLTEVVVPTPKGEQEGHAVTLMSALEDGRILETTSRPYSSTHLAADFLVVDSLPNARPTRLFVRHVEHLQALTKDGGTVAERSPEEFRARYAEIYDRIQQAEVAAGMRSHPDAQGRVRLTWKGGFRLAARSMLQRVRE